jgi:hypothetical protein
MEGTSQPFTISKKWKNLSCALHRKSVWVERPFPDLRSVPEASWSREQVSNHGRASTQTLLLYIKTWGQKTQCILGNLPKVQFPDPNESDINSLVQRRLHVISLQWRDFLVRKSVPFVLMHLNSSNHCGLEFYEEESTTVTSFSHDTQQVSWEKKIQWWFTKGVGHSWNNHLLHKVKWNKGVCHTVALPFYMKK